MLINVLAIHGRLCHFVVPSLREYCLTCIRKPTFSWNACICCWDFCVCILLSFRLERSVEHDKQHKRSHVKRWTFFSQYVRQWSVHKSGNKQQWWGVSEYPKQMRPKKKRKFKSNNPCSLLASVSELSQLFPALDDDLTAVGTQFTFDHHRSLQHHSSKACDFLDMKKTNHSEECNDLMMCSSGCEEDSDMPDVTEGDADMSLDLLACSSYETVVNDNKSIDDNV